ncbi:metal-sensing transcriptional repressor, partial [Streptomyces asiaticus]
HGGHGYAKQKDQHLKRLRRIEGQIRGLQRMVVRLSRRVGVLALGVSMAARPVLRALTGRPRALGRGGG